jgi:uncharacterized protein (UPF0332 family)
MVNVSWCKKQKKGIKLIEPNNNLAKEYIKNAEETLISLKNTSEDSNMWRATKKYYAQYLAIYALMMKIGIKSEIHECTIELAKHLEELEIIPKNTYEKLTKDKKLRIDNQYYLKNINVKINYEELQTFVLTIKEKINTINIQEIKQIKQKIKEIKK